MSLYRNRYRIESTRLMSWDYSWPGWYSVTIVSQHRRCIFGAIEHGRFIPSTIGQIVDARWRAIPDHFPRVGLDIWQVMPDHIHGILILAPTVRPHDVTLGNVIGGLKAAVSRQVHSSGLGPFGWQERFHDRILFDADAVDRMRHYIQDNPMRWRDKDALRCRGNNRPNPDSGRSQ